MSGHIKYEISKSHYGQLKLMRTDSKPVDAAYEQAVARALGDCLDAKISHARKGLFGPKITHITYLGQTLKLEQKQGVLGIDLLEVDDESRETILELMRQSPDFVRG